MEFTYKTATGNITIDVPEEWVAILKDCDRQEYNNNHTETRRHYHFDACEYEGEDFADDDDTIERLLEADAAKRTVDPLLEKLTPVQRDVIDALFYRHMTVTEYAASKGITKASVIDARNAALKKMKKYLKTAYAR